MSRCTHRITITLDVSTDLDVDTIERRLETFLDPADLNAQLLDGETIVVKETSIHARAQRLRLAATAADPMTPKLQPGDAVEVLHIWAHDTDPSWFGGYVYARTEPSGYVIVRHVGGHLDGCESRWKTDQVRAASADVTAARIDEPEPDDEPDHPDEARADRQYEQDKDDRITGDR